MDCNHISVLATEPRLNAHAIKSLLHDAGATLEGARHRAQRAQPAGFVKRDGDDQKSAGHPHSSMPRPHIQTRSNAPSSAAASGVVDDDKGLQSETVRATAPASSSLSWRPRHECDCASRAQAGGKAAGVADHDTVPATKVPQRRRRNRRR